MDTFDILPPLIGSRSTGDKVHLPQVRSERLHPTARRPLRDGTQHHPREDLHGAVVLVTVPVHRFCSW